MSERIVGEPRWPMTLAVGLGDRAHGGPPRAPDFGPRWVFPARDGDPPLDLDRGGPRCDHQDVESVAYPLDQPRPPHGVSALISTVVLIRDLIEVAPHPERDTLLPAGGSIWLINVVAFALLYWEFDCGGAARVPRGCRQPDFAFPQQLSPRYRLPVGARSSSITSTWGSRRRCLQPDGHDAARPVAKLTMALQAVISLAILGLVIARAVNVLQ